MDNLSPGKPKHTKQSFNILLHRALEEETEQQSDAPNSRPIVSTPLSCPNNPLDKATPWEPTFSTVIAKASLLPAPAVPAGQPVRVKYCRHKKGNAQQETEEEATAVVRNACRATVPPSYDSMELHRKMMTGKLYAGNSLSETEAEADDMEDDLYHQTAKKMKSKKSKRVKLLGAVNLGPKFQLKANKAV